MIELLPSTSSCILRVFGFVVYVIPVLLLRRKSVAKIRQCLWTFCGVLKPVRSYLLTFLTKCSYRTSAVMNWEKFMIAEVNFSLVDDALSDWKTAVFRSFVSFFRCLFCRIAWENGSIKNGFKSLNASVQNLDAIEIGVNRQRNKRCANPSHA